MSILQRVFLVVSFICLSISVSAEDSGSLVVSGDVTIDGKISISESVPDVVPSLPTSSEFADWQDLTGRPSVFFQVAYDETKALLEDETNECSAEFKTSALSALQKVYDYYQDYEATNLGKFTYSNLTVETDFYSLVREVDSINSSSCDFYQFRSPWNSSLRLLYGLDPSVATPIPGGRPLNELPAAHSKLDIAHSLSFGSGVRYLFLQNGRVIEPLFVNKKELPNEVIPDMPFCYVGLKKGIEGYVELRPRSQMRFDMRVKEWEFDGFDYDYVVFSNFRKRTSRRPNYDQNYTSYWNQNTQNYHYEVKDEALRIVACFQPSKNRTAPGSLFVNRNLQYLMKSNGLNLWLPIMSAVSVNPISFVDSSDVSNDPGDQFLFSPWTPTKPQSIEL